jgi:acyl-CoA reductase-like NAD-dependent aldehyde dehydrogenase
LQAFYRPLKTNCNHFRHALAPDLDKPPIAAGNYIGGKWSLAAGSQRRPVHSPIDGVEIGSIAWGNRETAATAIAAARAAKTSWRAVPIWERARFCRRIADEIEADLDRAFRFIEAMPTGIVNINDTSNYWELHIPFGGISGKDSGIGRLGGRHTLIAMSDIKAATISLG